MRSLKRSTLILRWIAPMAAVLLGAAPAQGSDVIYRKVADSATEVPGGDTISFIYSTSLDDGRTVFEADSSASFNGLWAQDAGQIEEIVDTDTLIPGTGDRFVDIGGYSQNEGTTLFYGEYPQFCNLGPCGGIYTADGGGLTLVVDTDTTVPGRSGKFEILDAPVIRSGGLAFRGATLGGFGFGFGAYADLGTGLVTVADWETPTPGGAGTLLFDFADPTIGIHDGEVFFLAVDSVSFETGYYAWDATSGDYRVLRDASTLVPGTASTFDTADRDAFRDGTYAFVGTHAGAPDEALYADFGDGLIEVVDANTLSAGWFAGPVEFLTVAAGAGTVAFTASDDGAFGDNRLFVYRHSDKSLTSILGSGDKREGRFVNRVELSRESLDGESVALLPDFKDTFQRELFVAALHTPRHQLLESPDLDGNGYGELLVLQQQPGNRKYKLHVRDAFTGGITDTIALGENPVFDMALIARPPQAPQVVVYSKNMVTGRLLAKLYALDDGSLVRTIQLWKDFQPIALTVVPDINGNGAPEIAALAESPKPFVRVQVVDTETEELLNVLVHGKTLRPVGIYTAEDLGGGSAVEVVILGVVRSTAKVRAIVQDPGDGTIVSDFFAGFDDTAPLLDATVTEDINGDGDADLVLARERPGQGKAGYEVRDLLGGAVVADRLRVTDARPLKTAAIEDVTNDGIAELGLLMVAPDGSSAVEIHDMTSQSLLETIDMLAIEDGRAVCTTADIDGSAAEEVVVLGHHFDLDMLEIHDVESGTPLRYHFLP